MYGGPAYLGPNHLLNKACGGKWSRAFCAILASPGFQPQQGSGNLDKQKFNKVSQCKKAALRMIISKAIWVFLNTSPSILTTF